MTQPIAAPSILTCRPAFRFEIPNINAFKIAILFFLNLFSP